MTHSFDKGYWEEHWDQIQAGADGSFQIPVNPYLIQETQSLTPGTALDAGCGTGAEALWLAGQGWQVTAADISANALAEAAARAAETSVSDRVTWVEADLTTWEPESPFDLVVTNYAHPALPQLDFYERISHWVAPGGTLLIVGHLHGPTPDADTAGHGHGHGHEHAHEQGHGHAAPPAEATASLTNISARLDSATWQIETAEERNRTMRAPDGSEVSLRDVIVRVTRRA